MRKAAAETKGEKAFDGLRESIEADPVRRGRVDVYRQAMREVMALTELRESRGVTQQQLAGALAVTQPNVSRIEHQDDLFLSTLRSYVEALGGRLELRAVFPDQTVVFGPDPSGGTQGQP